MDVNTVHESMRYIITLFAGTFGTTGLVYALILFVRRLAHI